MCIYEALTRRERYEHVVVSVPDGAQSAHNASKNSSIGSVASTR